jgi:hypothetical protein
MAEYLDGLQITGYELTNGANVDLIKLIQAGRPTEGYTKAQSVDELQVGQIVFVDALGDWRRGVVTKVGKTRVNVALTTTAAFEDFQAGRTAGARVQNSPYTATDVLVETGADAAEVAEEIAAEVEIAEPAEDEAKAEEIAVAELGQVEARQTAALSTGSTVVQALEAVWARIQKDVPELPAVVMVTGTGTKGIGPSRWGHFLPQGWEERSQEGTTYTHEMFIAGECLAKGARQVVQTMLHEAAHVLAAVRKVQDTSRQGRWHNAEFRRLAEEMGLEHKAEKADKAFGFSFVTLTPGTTEDYREVIEDLDAAIRITVGLPVWLGGAKDGEEDTDGQNVHGIKPPKAEGKGSSSNNVKATCACEEPRIIRVSRTVLGGAAIVCSDCDSEFMDRG